MYEIHRRDVYADAYTDLILHGGGRNKSIYVSDIPVSLVLSLIMATRKTNPDMFTKHIQPDCCLKLSNRLKPGLGARELLF